MFRSCFIKMLRKYVSISNCSNIVLRKVANERMLRIGNNKIVNSKEILRFLIFLSVSNCY